MAVEPVPNGLTVELFLGTDPEDNRMMVLCSGPRGSGEQTVVVATKQPWTEAELRAIIEAESNALGCEHRNDKFSRHDGPAMGGVSLMLISPANEVDIAKFAKQESVLVRETSTVYEAVTRPFVDALPAKQLAWVHAILDRKAEMDVLLYEDAHCMLLPDSKWADQSDLSQLYVLAILKERTVRSVRDLHGRHATALRELRDGVLGRIRELGVHANQVRAYFHYHPSFWLGHVHFNVIGCRTVGSGLSAGKALLLDDVIDALERDPSHFETAAITYAVGKGDKLYGALRAAGAVG